MPPAGEAFLQQIDELVDEGRETRARLLDDPALQWIDPELLDSVAAVLGKTAQLLEDAERAFSGDGEAEERPGAARGIGDLAWMARREVLRNLDELKAARSRNQTWEIVSEADNALERAERALTALESHLREALGLPPSRRFDQRKKEALEVRRLYTALHRTFLLSPNPEGEQLVDELWALGRQLDAIRDEEVYGMIRVGDRRLLRKLRVRIEAAMDLDDRDAESERRRLWQDLRSFSRLLMSIHEREDLRIHDLGLVTSARRSLRSGAPAEEIFLRLRPLLGRDPELDRLLLVPGNVDGREGDRILSRVETELRHQGDPFGGSGSLRPGSETPPAQNPDE